VLEPCKDDLQFPQKLQAVFPYFSLGEKYGNAQEGIAALRSR
jgi:hypothetical protein